MMVPLWAVFKPSSETNPMAIAVAINSNSNNNKHIFNVYFFFVTPDCSWLETNSPPHGGCTWRNRARTEGVSGTHSYSRREYDLCLSKTRGVNAPVTQVTGDTTPRGSSPPGASGVNPSFLNPSFFLLFFF